jgi:hypothetical protein
MSFFQMVQTVALVGLVQAAESLFNFIRSFAFVIFIIPCFYAWGWIGVIIAFVLGLIYNFIYAFYLEKIIRIWRLAKEEEKKVIMSDYDMTEEDFLNK